MLDFADFRVVAADFDRGTADGVTWPPSLAVPPVKLLEVVSWLLKLLRVSFELFLDDFWISCNNRLCSWTEVFQVDSAWATNSSSNWTCRVLIELERRLCFLTTDLSTEVAVEPKIKLFSWSTDSFLVWKSKIFLNGGLILNLSFQPLSTYSISVIRILAFSISAFSISTFRILLLTSQLLVSQFCISAFRY